MGQVTGEGLLSLGEPTPGCPGGVLGVPNLNTETLTASNGDTLTIRMEDLACPTGPSSFHGTGRWTITGGTGSFEHATGQGTSDGGADFATGTFTFTLSGTLAGWRGASDEARRAG
jgi:hypothetical protein